MELVEVDISEVPERLSELKTVLETSDHIRKIELAIDDFDSDLALKYLGDLSKNLEAISK